MSEGLRRCNWDFDVASREVPNLNDLTIIYTTLINGKTITIYIASDHETLWRSIKQYDVRDFWYKTSLKDAKLVPQ